MDLLYLDQKGVRKPRVSFWKVRRCCCHWSRLLTPPSRGLFCNKGLFDSSSSSWFLSCWKGHSCSFPRVLQLIIVATKTIAAALIYFTSCLRTSSHSNASDHHSYTKWVGGKRDVERGKKKCHSSISEKKAEVTLHSVTRRILRGIETRLLLRDYSNLGLVITLAFLLGMTPWPLQALQRPNYNVLSIWKYSSFM